MIQEIHITNLIYNITFISIILSVIPLHFVMNEWMNEWMFNDTPARKTDRLLGVRKR